jgi:hypothetical protein
MNQNAKAILQGLKNCTLRTLKLEWSQMEIESNELGKELALGMSGIHLFFLKASEEAINGIVQQLDPKEVYSTSTYFSRRKYSAFYVSKITCFFSIFNKRRSVESNFPKEFRLRFSKLIFGSSKTKKAQKTSFEDNS